MYAKIKQTIRVANNDTGKPCTKQGRTKYVYISILFHIYLKNSNLMTTLKKEN